MRVKKAIQEMKDLCSEDKSGTEDAYSRDKNN